MNWLRKAILPDKAQHPKYIQFVSWSFASNILVSAEHALATHSMLNAIDNGSEAWRSFNYIGKDIIGQLGGLGYMAKMAKKADQNPHQFLFYSNAIQQASFLAVCTTPLVPAYFLPIAGCSNIFSNIAFTCYGALNAKCIQTIATNNNTGEVYAKITMVNTLGSSIGLLLGLGITLVVPDHASRLAIIPLLAIGRIYTFGRAISGLI